MPYDNRTAEVVVLCRISWPRTVWTEVHLGWLNSQDVRHVIGGLKLSQRWKQSNSRKIPSIRKSWVSGFGMWSAYLFCHNGENKVTHEKSWVSGERLWSGRWNCSNGKHKGRYQCKCSNNLRNRRTTTVYFFNKKIILAATRRSMISLLATVE